MTCAFSFGNHGAVVKDPHNWKMAEMRFRISAIQRVKKPRSVCRPQTAKKYNHFLSRHVRERKYSSVCCAQNLSVCDGQIMRAADRKPFVGKTRRFFRQSQKRRIATTLLLCRGKGVRGIFRYLSCFFFLLRAAAPVAAPPLASTRTSHKERLLVSPVGGVFGSFAVTVSALVISLVPSLSL